MTKAEVGEGMQVAIEQALVEGEVLEFDEAEQLGLFAPPQTEEGQRKSLVKSRIGRPPGARNKRTVATVDYLLSRHRDPREVLLEIAEANVADLAALLGCTLFEAVQEKRLCAAAVLPYVAQRQPLSIETSARNPVYLTIVDGQAAPADNSAAGAIEARVVHPDDVELLPLGEEGDDAP